MKIAKKIFYASLLIFIVSFLFLGIYRLSFYKPTEVLETKKEETETTNQNNSPTKDLTKIAVISDEAVLSPVLSPDGLSVKYYSQKTGRAYQIDLDGTNKKTLSDKELIGLSSVIWSPDKTKVITKFTNGNGIVQFYYYNYSTNISSPLKKNLDEVSWDSMGNKIFYKYYNPETKERTLNIADPDGNNWKKLTDLSYKNVVIAPVPQSTAISFWNKADSFSETIMESISIVGGDKKTIYKGTFGTDYLWNNSGTNILVNHTDKKGGSKMQVAILNFNGGEYANLGIPTFISKCAWSKDNKTIFYSIPGSVQDTAILPNDYNEGKFKTSDTFWKVDIVSKQPKRIIELSDLQKINLQFDATNLFLSLDEKYIFFINKLDGKLYRLSL